MKTVMMALAFLAFAQEGRKGKPGRPEVDEFKVAEAIRKGVAFLKPHVGRLDNYNIKRPDELVLLTFIHAGVAETDPEFQALLRKMLETKLEWTYNVAVQAMCLEELDRVKHQARIWQCAQFLVDNQCATGQWAYGEPSTFVDDVPTEARKGKAVATSPAKKAPGKAADSGRREKPKVVRTIPVKKMRDGPAAGDNSNSQYAALGLRACHDAGIVLPRETIERAERWWRQAQRDGAAEGWTYGPKASSEAYGSMSAGALGGLVICAYLQGRPWTIDEAVVRGMEWLVAKFTVRDNPGIAGEGGSWHLYYLYALERLGILYGTDKIGGHDWYAEGAGVLLDLQNPDGSWMSKGATHAIWDTCFAVLFLRRATRPLVESTDQFYKK